MSIRTAVFITLGLGVGFTSASAQNANDIFRLFGGMMQTAIIQATLDQWRKISEGEVACVDQNLRQQGSSLQRAIQQGITPSDPRIAGSRAACRNQIAQQPMWQGPSFDCSKARMPDERAICSDAELSKLDNLVAGGYNYLRSRYGVQFAESIGAPIAAPDSITTRGVEKSIYIVNGDQKSRSKWARALRYAAGNKPKDESIKKFFKREGGINACASRYAEYVRRPSKV